MHHPIELNAMVVCKILQDAGHTAVFAGGYVRDRYLLQELGGFKSENFEESCFTDIDIATDALPGQVTALFTNTAFVGKCFGVTLVKVGGFTYEVATFRKDTGSTDGRHPDSVTFTTMEEDAQRRDFTINGVFYDPVKDKYYDYVDGISDLKNNIIKFIGDPETRIKEDYLRMLRFVRFILKYSLSIDKDSLADVSFLSVLIKKLPAERILQEMDKILLTRAGRTFDLLWLTKIIQLIIPELIDTYYLTQRADYHPEGTVWEHIRSGFAYLKGNEPEDDASLDVIWAWLLHDLGKAKTQVVTDKGAQFIGHEKISTEMAIAICDRLKMSNERTDKIVHLVKNHMRIRYAPQMKRSKFRKLISGPYFKDQLALYRIDVLASDGDLSIYDAIITRYAKEDTTETKTMLENPTVTGNMIKSWGYKEGVLIGEIKQYFQDIELSGKLSKSTEYLRAMCWQKFPVYSRITGRVSSAEANKQTRERRH